MADKVTQVRLRSDTTETVCWIDNESARLGVLLRIEDDDDGRIYTVVGIGDTIDHAAMKKQEMYHRTHRKGSDI